VGVMGDWKNSQHANEVRGKLRAILMDVTRDFQIVTAGAEKPDTEQRVHQFEQSIADKSPALDKYVHTLTSKISDFLMKMPEEKAALRRQQIQHALSSTGQPQGMNPMPVNVAQPGGMSMGRGGPRPNTQPAQPVPVQPVTVQPVGNLGIRMPATMNQVPPASMKSPQPQPVPVPRVPGPNMANQSPMSTLSHPSGPIHVAPAPSDDIQIIENPGAPRSGPGMPNPVAPKFMATRGPGQPIDPKKDIPTVPVAMTGATMSPTGSGPTTSNQNPNMTQVNPNAAAANMNATREELEAKVNAKLNSLATYKTWLLLLLKRMEKTQNKKAEEFKKRVLQVNNTVNQTVTAAMTKENLATFLAQLTEAELQLKTPTFENLFNNVRYQTSNVQRSFEQFFDTLKTEAPDVAFAKQVKTYFKMSQKGSLDFTAIAKQISDKPEELFWWEHMWSKKREHALISMKTEDEVMLSMDSTPVDEPPHKRRRLATTVFDNALDYIKKIVSEDLYWKAPKIIDENIMVLEEFGSSKQLIVNCQPQDEGATTFYDLAFKDASVMFPTFEIVQNKFSLTFDNLVRDKISKSKKANQPLLSIIRDILGFCKLFMVKTSVFLEDMALLDSIDIEEEIIDNAIYLKLSIAKHSAPLYLHFTNITKYPQSTPSYHFVQQDGMDMDKLQVYSQKFARTLPQRQLIVQDGQKISQVSTSEIVNHWLKTPFE
jgi:hypothetical protein